MDERKENYCANLGGKQKAKASAPSLAQEPNEAGSACNRGQCKTSFIGLAHAQNFS
ncbi:hypothetical protein GBA52_017306 [Prunus armeniaca]|nr:hypothetical protein GBA52_017306 [Prunus armeniaca]